MFIQLVFLKVFTFAPLLWFFAQLFFSSSFSFLIFLYSLYAPKNGMWDSIYSSINRCRIKRKTQKWCHQGQEHSTSYEFKVLFRCIQLFEHRTKKTEKTKARVIYSLSLCYFSISLIFQKNMFLYINFFSNYSNHIYLYSFLQIILLINILLSFDVIVNESIMDLIHI